MRAPFLLVLTCFTLAGFSQFTENFTDGDFTTNPTWSGDASKFIIDNGELRSNSNTASDNFYLSTPSTLATGDIEWQFRVNMKFSTSGANYTDVFLMADNADLSAVSNGYFVRIGNTDDEVSLYKIVAGTETQLTDGTDDKTHNKNITLKVTKGALGTWAIHADYTGGTSYQVEGSVTDNDITTSTHFGFLTKQSVASFHLNHFYDDIYVGPLLLDTQKPTIISTESLDANTIKITADEAVNTSSTVFTLNNGYGSPSNVTVNGNEILLAYNTALINSSYQLTIDLLGDLAGNQLDTVVPFDYFIASKPRPGDLLFTEIFADPTPTIGLPEEEFFEIYNTSSETLDLENCTFSDGGTPAVFPKVTIASQAYLIVVKSGNESLFSSLGKSIGLNGYPALNNSGDNLELRNENGSLLVAVNYTDDYYNDDLKKQGGYSMELIDFSTFCSPIDNWTASTDASGGTPGKQNSVLGVNPDQQAPQILSVLISDSTEITVTLDENMHPGLAANLNNFEIVEIGSNPINIDIDEAEHTLKLTFLSNFQTSTKYTLLINNLSDCKGNEINWVEREIVTIEMAVKGDVLINELLFNPTADGVDFIELYNSSDKFIDLSTLLLARYNDNNRESIKLITATNYILYPKQFVALTIDTSALKKGYITKRLWQVSSLPAMNNDAGTVLLLNTDSSSLDSVVYSEEQHFELFSDVDGVSLERINYDIAYSPMSWHSASTSAGYATPGYQNSQLIITQGFNSTFSLVSKTISPDGDGYQDVLAIQYELDATGILANGYVYDLSGSLVQHVINNAYLAPSGTLTWDGVLHNGSKIPIGNYILLLQTIDLDGKSVKKKLAFSVAGRF
jgi:hypothetical protein